MANPARSLAADFRAFLTRGNVIELAIAFMLGAAFGDVIKSVAADLIAPIIGVVFGDLNFVDYFAVGQFATRVISFLITALVLFFIVRLVSELHRRQKTADEKTAPTTKDCQFCYSKIPVQAIRCPQCTSNTEAGAVPAA